MLYSLPMASFKPAGVGDTAHYLDGQMLIAMPTMLDPRFERAVIYLCAHSREGAMGIVVNKPAQGLTFPDLLGQLDITPDPASQATPEILAQFPVHNGGPVESARGFVLHTSDYHSDDCSLPIDPDISLTATIDVLRAIANGKGPQHALLALGYAGWGAGQLDIEMQTNGWLNCTADPGLLFDCKVGRKYHQAMAKIGVDPAMLASDAGHA
ncbi:MAG: YqgE/AlgH family protein [Alphaproteobacteria bacterium]